MAAWDLPQDVLRRVVGGAKRSHAYRGLRDQLVSPCPRDVWLENGHGFVEFELDCEPGGRPGWLVFAVASDGRLAAAKRLVPDERGENLVVTDLLEAGAAIAR